MKQTNGKHGGYLDVGADEDGELDREPSDEIAHRPQFSRSLRVFHAIFGQSQLAGSRDAVQRDLYKRGGYQRGRIAACTQKGGADLSG